MMVKSNNRGECEEMVIQGIKKERKTRLKKALESKY
jgi:hypothetical protein